MANQPSTKQAARHGSRMIMASNMTAPQVIRGQPVPLELNLT
jgi:alpha-D-ribose 1-methylphosphonate 5-triphosphate diphosphatase PhnM